MRRTMILGVYLFIFFLFTSPVRAEYIKEFISDSTIHTDGRVTVTETIVYDFETAQKHGIFRKIPLEKTNQNNRTFILGITDITVSDQNGIPYKFSTTTKNNSYELKIGNPDLTISGTHIYRISYTLSGALTYFSDHDELFWNAIGTDWDVPIYTFTGKVRLPLEIPIDQVKVECFTGSTGSTTSECTKKFENNQVIIESESPFKTNEGITYAVGFPKDVVQVLEPTPIYNLFDSPFFAVGIILLGFIWYVVLPIYIFIRWIKFGRDPKPTIGQASVWFSAPKFHDTKQEVTPAELALLLREQISPTAITATIVDLAHKGYLTMKELNKKELLVSKTAKVPTGLLTHEQQIYDDIFGAANEVSTKDISLYSTFQSLRSSMAKQSVVQGLYVKDPYLQKILYSILGVFGIISGNILLAVSSFIFGMNMPKRTQRGADMAAMGRSLNNFLTSQERQYTFQAKEYFLFEKLLPYAVALGVEKVWAKRFEGLQIPPPSWYHGNTFSPVYLSQSLHASFRSVESTMTTTTSSSGFSSGFSGGSVGGGGGGGGGGSW